MNNFKLRSPEATDIEVILDINNSRLDRENTKGFVLTEYTQLSVLEKMQDGVEFLVIENTDINEVIGFIENKDGIDERIPDEIFWSSKDFMDNFVSYNPRYIERLCILDDPKASGAGSFAYTELFKKYPNRSFYAFTVSLPITNEASLKFHEKMGFENAGAYEVEELYGLEDYESTLFLLKK